MNLVINNKFKFSEKKVLHNKVKFLFTNISVLAVVTHLKVSHKLLNLVVIVIMSHISTSKEKQLDKAGEDKSVAPARIVEAAVKIFEINNNNNLDNMDRLYHEHLKKVKTVCSFGLAKVLQQEITKKL